MGSRMGIESSPGRTDVIRRLGSVSYWEDEDEKVFVLERERSGRQLQSHGGYFDCTHGGGGCAVWMAACLTVLLAAVVLAAHVFALSLAGPDNYIAALPSTVARQLTPGVSGQTSRFMSC